MKVHACFFGKKHGNHCIKKFYAFLSRQEEGRRPNLLAKGEERDHRKRHVGWEKLLQLSMEIIYCFLSSISKLKRTKAERLVQKKIKELTSLFY